MREARAERDVWYAGSGARYVAVASRIFRIATEIRAESRGQMVGTAHAITLFDDISVD